MIKCIVIAENEFEGAHEFPSLAEFDAFAKGVDVGVNLYGGGSCYVVTRSDLGQYGKTVDDLIREHLPATPTPPPG